MTRFIYEVRAEIDVDVIGLADKYKTERQEHDLLEEFVSEAVREIIDASVRSTDEKNVTIVDIETEVRRDG